MRILIIEDDANKAEQIHSCVASWSPAADVIIRRSFQSGLREAITSPADLVLLDMTMPTYDVGPREPGGRDRRYAGREILRQLARREIIVPVVVITQYEQFEEGGVAVTLPELVANLETDYPRIFRGAVFYQAGDTAWTNKLKTLLSTLEDRNATR